MLAGHLALAVASLFTGAAFFINFAEHPARRGLDDRAFLAHWQPSYRRGYAMQATLAIGGCLLGLLAGWQTGHPAFAAGALLLVANWPWTLLAMMPTNAALMATASADSDHRTRALLARWNRLHAVRTGLGILAVAAFLLALS